MMGMRPWALIGARREGGAAMLTHGTLDPSQLIIPLIILIIDIGIVMYCLDDLLKPERQVAGGNKAVWAIILIFSGIGWIAYLAFGRQRS